MSRNGLIATFVGAMTLGFGALSAQAASVPMHDLGFQPSLAQKAHYRHHHHRYYGYYRHHHYYYYRHHHHRYC